MRIGIVGAGQIGSILARKLRSAGHDMLLANSRGAETLAGLARELGVTAVNLEDAVREVDVIIVSIPEDRVPQLSGLFEGIREGMIIVDTGNYYPRVRDAEIAAIEAGTPESQWVSQQLGHPVVKVFNSILAQSLDEKGRPSSDKHRIALPVAGDDPHAKAIVMGLVDAIGFEPVDAGDLSQSWRQQPGTAAYCTDLPSDRLHEALDLADRAGAPLKRDLAIKAMIELGSELTNEKWVELNRSIFGTLE